MKKLNTLIFLCLLATGLIAQEQTRILCGYDIAVEAREASNPGFQEAALETFQDAKKIASQGTNKQNVYTIPLVVHIVWKDSVENLADSIIQAQVDVLNADFRRLNTDAGNIRPIFDGIVGDPMIEFDLVAVERVQTTIDFEPGLTALPDDEIKRTANGGSDGYDTETHLNIWVCELQPLTFYGIPLGQILGYAYPPAAHPNWPEGSEASSPDFEGVVIDYRTFGPNNPNEIDAGTGPLDIRGRTPVHEVGHYLGLRHIWGDGSPLGGDSCADDDMLDDTPNAGSQSSFDCDTTRNTCIDAMNDRPDMIENYMDYSAESCMNSFTNDQIAIMRAVLEGPRCGLINVCVVATEEEEAIKASLNIYPNPTTGEFSITLANPALTDLSIEVKDIMGRSLMKVAQTKAVDATYELDLSSFTNGVYLVEVRTNDGVFAKKVLLNK